MTQFTKVEPPGHFVEALQEFDRRQRDFDSALRDAIEHLGCGPLSEALHVRQTERNIAWNALMGSLKRCLVGHPSQAVISGAL